MHNFWHVAVKPIIEATAPSTVVEIGVFMGHNTRELLELEHPGLVVHSVDPEPHINVDEWVARYAGRLVFHRRQSLDVIPELPQFQVGLIDGDHNWYTVYNELRLISERHEHDPAKFPVLLFHDVAWPYGRRDLYYDQRRIPEEFRHPSARKGIHWNQSELAEHGGLNKQLDNAVFEGGPRNGVLTAIEDFLRDSSIRFHFIRVPAYFGFGILVTEEIRKNCARLAAFLEELTEPTGLMRMISHLEEIRAKAMVHQQSMHWELLRLRNQIKEHETATAAREEKRAASFLSIVVVVHNMRREAHRTLHSLSRAYQRGIETLEYEVIVIDNGSDEPLGEDAVRAHGKEFSYVYLQDAPKSPARAINVGVQRATGDLLAIMIDGAHVLTPGVIRYAMQAFAMYPNPVVAPRYWFVGPGQQGETIASGYDAGVEDELFRSIGWPANGYRLFEIGVFIGHGNGWMSRFFESNCLFLRRKVFDAIGGANEKFDSPGGGFLNLDLLREASEANGVDVVTIMGEATFHQLHGGITTNVAPEVREERVAAYREQYRQVRGREYQVPKCAIHYVGHRPALEREQFAFRKPGESS